MADTGQAAASSSAETESEAVVGRVREAVAEWRDVLMGDPLIVELIRQSDDEKMGEAEPKFLPVEDAVQCLLWSLEKASVSPALITEMEDVLSTMVALSIRAATSDPAALAAGVAGADTTSHAQSSAGLSIRSTALGRRASASYRVFDRVGGWEILSACVDGVYMRVMKDERIGPIQMDAEQTLKTTLVEFLSAAFAGIHGRTASQSMWEKHQRIVHELGLHPSYFDCVIEHFQATLDELGVPHDEAEAAITALRTSRPSLENMDNMERTSSMPTRLSLFGRQSLRTSASMAHDAHGPEHAAPAAAEEAPASL